MPILARPDELARGPHGRSLGGNLTKSTGLETYGIWRFPLVIALNGSGATGVVSTAFG